MNLRKLFLCVISCCRFQSFNQREGDKERKREKEREKERKRERKGEEKEKRKEREREKEKDRQSDKNRNGELKFDLMKKNLIPQIFGLL